MMQSRSALWHTFVAKGTKIDQLIRDCTFNFLFLFFFFFRALELEANNDIKNKSGNAASIPVNTVAGSFDCNSVRFSPEKRAISHDLS